MRNKIARHSLLLFFFFCAESYAADTGVIEKSKQFTQSYLINRNDKISINVSFGDITIVTWSRNEVKLEATMQAKANTAEKAQEMLDMLSIESDKTGNIVSFKTAGSLNINTNPLIERLYSQKPIKSSNEIDLFENESLKTTCILYLPDENYLSADDQFGSLIIGDRNGPTKLKNSFGSLTAGKLLEVDTVLAAFGKASIDGIGSGVLTIASSNAQVNHASGDLRINIAGSYAKIKMGSTLKKLLLNTAYSELQLEVEKETPLAIQFSGFYKGDSAVINHTPFLLNGLINPHSEAGFQRFEWKQGNGSIPITLVNQYGNIVLGYHLDFNSDKQVKAGEYYKKFKSTNR